MGQGWGWVKAGGESRLGVGQGWGGSRLGWVKAKGWKADGRDHANLHTTARVHPTYNPEFLAGILIKGSVPFNGQMYKILKFIDLLDGCGTL